MISEQEAREAATFLFVMEKDTTDEMLKYERVTYEQIRNAEKLVADWALQELARREAERAERALPITAEWLKSIGFQDGGAWRYVPGVNVRVGAMTFSVWCGTQPVSSITTRGQLLDLLNALKGGEA